MLFEAYPPTSASLFYDLNYIMFTNFNNNSTKYLTNNTQYIQLLISG